MFFAPLHERGLLLPLGLLAVALGAASAALSLVRRWVQGNAVADMEKDIRDDLYAHLQRLEPAFHDEWQSGQLLSRATTDLSSIRRFAGFGLVFLVIAEIGSVKAYFDPNAQASKDVQGLLQPLQNLSGRCTGQHRRRTERGLNPAPVYQRRRRRLTGFSGFDLPQDKKLQTNSA